jgi:hypothetical protein
VDFTGALVEAARRVDLHHTKGDGLSSSPRFFYQIRICKTRVPMPLALPQACKERY